VKISKKQFELFKKEVLKWLDIFGMKNWQVHFEQRKIEENRAQITFNCVSGIAVFTLSTNWDEQNLAFVTDENVCKSAFHEVCELLLGRLNDMTEQRYNLSRLDVEEEIHRIIRTLENTVFPMLGGK